MPEPRNRTQRHPFRAILTPYLVITLWLFAPCAFANSESSRPTGPSAWGILLAVLAVLVIGLYVQSTRKRIH